MIWYDVTDSTNDRVKELARNGAPAGTAVAAGSQTGGRGRRGRSFYSPKATGMYLSYLFRPEKAVEACMHLTCACAVASVRAIKNLCGITPGIKWPNDLCYEGRKLGGILTEVSATEGKLLWAVVGIGINCRTPEGGFPAEIAEIAQSLEAVSGKSVDPRALAEKIAEELGKDLIADAKAYMEEYRGLCVTMGKAVQVITSQDVREAFAEAVDDQGGLLVRYPDGTQETVSSGEVSVRGMYGYL